MGPVIFCSSTERTTSGLSRVSLACARRVQLGARVVRRDRAERGDKPRCGSSRRTAASPDARSPRCPRARRVANCLRGSGVGRGDRLLLMLRQPRRTVGDDAGGNEARRGIIPATPAARPGDLRDRVRSAATFARGGARARASKFEGVLGGYALIAVGEPVAGWHRTPAIPRRAADAFTPDGPTRATDPLLLYFTSGTTGEAQAGRA